MTISTKTSERIAGMSFLCAFFVVMMHVGTAAKLGTTQWWFFRFIGNTGVLRVAVPFFFLASGYFLAAHFYEKGWYRTALKSRLRTLLVPYVVCNVLYCLFLMALGLAINTIGYSPSSYNLETIQQFDILHVLGLRVFMHPILGPTWYIRNLLLLMAISPILVSLKEYWHWLLGVLFLIQEICFAFSYGNESMTQFVLYSFSPEGLLYFTLGMFLQSHHIKVPMCVRGGGRALFIALSIILVSALLECFGVSQWTMVLWGVFIPFAMYGIWCVTPLERLGRRMRNYTFPLYIIHWPVNLVLSGVVGVLGLKELGRESIMFYLLRVAIVVFVSLLIARVIRKSRLCDMVLFGGR